MYPYEKNTNHLTVRGGEGLSTLTVSLTVRYPFFLTTSLSLISKFLFSLISEFLFTVLKEEVTKKVFWQETFLQLVTTACPHLIKMLFARHKLASKIQNLTCILVSLIWS